MNMNDFYRGKKVFVTGHTGFKGTWMCKVLKQFGAEVCGYALVPKTTPNLFELIEMEKEIQSVMGDIRDYELLEQTLKSFNPDIVFHLAAQPLVRESYAEPRYTYETNVMGTVNLLEAARHCEMLKSILNVTTDKVYKNNEWCYGYRENDVLDGYDPYSNSKSCSELVTASYRRSFFENKVGVSTARAGNVIGGGDYSVDRIIPDCVRFTERLEPIVIRNPHSIRPYQHVLESVFAYLEIAKVQYLDSRFSGSYNIGPDEGDCVATGDLVESFCKIWGKPATYYFQNNEGVVLHEANFLKLDNSKAKSILNIHPIWHVEHAIEKVVEFEQGRIDGAELKQILSAQIKSFDNARMG